MMTRILRKLMYLLFPKRRHPGSRVKPIEAAAAVFLVKENQNHLVFMIKNQGSVKLFPGYHEFPWKKIDNKAAPSHQAKALSKIAKEFGGFDLESALQSGRVKPVKSLGTASTWEFISPGFSIRFYLIELSERPEFSLDSQTIAEAEWKTPGEYLQLYREGHMLALPSSIDLLEKLAEHTPHPFGAPLSRGDMRLRETPANNSSPSEVPCFQPLAGIYQFIPIAFTIPPDYVHRTNCFAVGDRGEPVVLVDPSPQDDNEYRKLVKTLEKIGLTYTAVFITHHHVDHHLGAPRLAREFSLSMIMSEYTYRRIVKKSGEKYFENLEIKLAREGDVLTRWLGKDVKVYQVPGHDEGQLALAPESMEWFIVGDLIQSQGTVMIGEDEGDMAKYYQSLERVIRLNPRVLFPSHGLPIGTTFQLQDTLKHRRLRENQILALYKKGKSPSQMVKIMYKGVDRRLWPLALENIKSHLKKLKQEQALS